MGSKLRGNPKKLYSSPRKGGEYFEVGKTGYGIRFKLSNSKTITWIHRMVTIGVIAYLVGIKGWL